MAPAREDLAYALEYVVPFRGDDECLRWLRYPAPANRRRRLERFAEAYGLTSTDGLVDQVIAVQRADLDLARAPSPLRATNGRSPWFKRERFTKFGGGSRGASRTAVLF